MFTWLQGKKTYFMAGIAGVTIVVRLLKGSGLPVLQGIPDDVFTYILTACGFGGMVTMRSAMAKR